MRRKNEDELTEILKKIAPGTTIREGLDNILRAKTGGLLLITDNKDIIQEVVDRWIFYKRRLHIFKII